MSASTRRFCTLLACVVALGAGAPVAAAQGERQGAGEGRWNATSTVALEPKRTSTFVRVLRYVAAGVLIVAALGWAGRARARRGND